MSEWKPVYLTDDERAAIVGRLLAACEVDKIMGDTASASNAAYLAGLIVFCDARAEAAG